MNFGWTRAPRPDYRDLRPDAVGELDAYRVLDVRGPDEFHGPLGHLPGATLVPVSLLPQRLSSLGLAKDERLLIVCRSGARSAQAAAFLASRGFSDVANLAGGMMGWRAHGRHACGEHHGAGFVRCAKAA